MADPFLLAHLVGPRIFDLSGKLNPISIRDQMVRGRMLIDRAFEANLIGPDESLLVIGSGACGATAAVRAAERETQTLLIDKNPYVDGVPESFRLQDEVHPRDHIGYSPKKINHICNCNHIDSYLGYSILIVQSLGESDNIPGLESALLRNFGTNRPII